MSNSKSKMSVLQLTLLTAVNMMGSGIIMLPTKLAQIGTISILSWLVTAVGSMCLAYAFAKCGRYSKKLGGMGGMLNMLLANQVILWQITLMAPLYLLPM